MIMRLAERSFRVRNIVACVTTAFSMMGYPQSVSATDLPVGNCLDDGDAQSLRVVAGGASSGDTVDMSALPLVCSEITLAVGSCAINIPHGVTLKGPGADKLSIHGNQCPIIVSPSSERLNINDLTLADGSVYSSVGNVQGGCVNSGGDVFVTRSIITNCSATTAAEASAKGGAIFTPGIANLLNSSITHSSATAGYLAIGGATSSNDLVMAYSTISENTVTVTNSSHVTFARGGGAFITNGALVLNSSTIDANSATYGGGIARGTFDCTNATTDIFNSTVSGNSATSFGGGFFHFCYGYPAAVPSFKIYNSTVAFNAAAAAGGLFVNVDIYSRSSIFGNNKGNGGGDDLATFGSNARTISGANNLAVSSNVTASDGVITVTSDPRLTPLDYHGASSNPELLYARTHGLSISSPAIAAGDNLAGLIWDERGNQNGGFLRTRGGVIVDIGAFERQPNDDELFYGGFN
jgi:hypothetical protein